MSPAAEWYLPKLASKRAVNEVLDARFTVALNSPSDIYEHLGVLHQYAQHCEHITEFGMRGAGGSTVAFLTAQPETLISWDINPWSIVSQPVADLLRCAGRTNFQPRVGDTLKIIIEPTDMLFIDTLHTAKQLWNELVRHADPVEDKVKKFLAFHDTTTFAYNGEDGSEHGLRDAIRKFQKEHAFPVWQLVEDRDNCNGLAILRNVRHT